MVSVQLGHSVVSYRMSYAQYIHIAYQHESVFIYHSFIPCGLDFTLIKHNSL